MASPFVAGIVATWLEAYPDLTPEQLHEITASTARTDNFTSTAPDCNWGYGKINAMEGLKKCLEIKTAGCESIDDDFSGSLTVEDGNIIICSARSAQAAICVTDLSGHSILYKDFGIMQQGDTTTLPLPSLDKGVYVVALKTGKTIKTYKFVCR